MVRSPQSPEYLARREKLLLERERSPQEDFIRELYLGRRTPWPPLTIITPAPKSITTEELKNIFLEIKNERPERKRDELNKAVRAYVLEAGYKKVTWREADAAYDKDMNCEPGRPKE